MTPQRLRQFQAFHFVMRTGSVSQAADALSISQPAASKLLQALEGDLHLVLFDRSRRRLTPTADAARLEAEVEQLFRATKGIDQLASELRSAIPGRLRIAAMPLLGAAVIPSWIARFARRNPGLRSSLKVLSSRQVARSVAAGETDIGFALALSSDLDVTRRLLAEVPAVIVLPENHPLAARETLAPKDLEGEAFVSLGHEDEARDLVDSLFESHLVRRAIDIETNISAAACALVAAGAGVTVVDAITAGAFADRLAVRPLYPTVRFKIEMLTSLSQPPSDVVGRFLRFSLARTGELLPPSLAELGMT